MKLNFLPVLLFTLVGSVAVHAQSWTNEPDMKLKRSESAAVEYQGQLYVFNGFSQGLHVGNSIEKYNPANKQWTLLGSTSVANGTAVTHTGTVLVGNEVWLIGGRIGSHPGQVSNKVWIYNLASNNWRPGPNLPIPMAGGGAALVKNKIHVFGGMDAFAKCDVNYHYVFNLNNQNAGWSNLTSTAGMPSARNHFSTVVIDDIIYAVGGQHGHDGCPGVAGGNVALVHSYNPQSSQWQRLADLPAIESHNEPSTFVHNGFIYTVGGATAGDAVLRYDPAVNQWEHIVDLPERLLAPVARIYNGRLVVGGGGAPITAKSITTVRSIGLSKFNDVAIGVTGNGNTGTNTNTNTNSNSGNTANTSSSVIISVEAEDFSGRAGTGTHQWVNASLPNASGGDSMKTTPNSGALKANASGSPMLAYDIQFSEAGNYYLWVRGWGDENANGQGTDDSLHAGVNGALSASADKIDGFPSGWNWSKRTRDGSPAVVQIPSAGVHTVNLWMREDGFAVDKFVLAKNTAYVPQGLGPSSNQTVSNTGPVTPTNSSPTVVAGTNATSTVGTTFNAQGQVNDDGLPNGVLDLQWSKVSGPGTVIFTQPTAIATGIDFSATGVYVLKLSATDGSLWASDTFTVTVQSANNAGTSGAGQSANANGTVIIEAEDYINKTGSSSHQWVSANYPNASGGESMITTPDQLALKSNSVGSPMLSYAVNFSQSGLHHVWIRGWGDENLNGQGTSDSIHAGINGVLAATADKIDGFPSGWNWSKRTRDGAPAIINVPSAGTHTFNLWMREDGFAVDKIILTKDAAFIPTGLGANTTQSNSGTNVATNTAPVVNAGSNTSVMINANLNLNAVVSDDNTPVGSLQIEWNKLSGPGVVTFSNASSTSTNANFSTAGNYVLQLSANDGSLIGTDTLAVVVNNSAVTTNQNLTTTLSVEAEDYFVKTNTVTHQWVAASLNGASGNASMITTPNNVTLKNGSSGSPMMSYPLNFAEGGVYYVWVRGWGDEQSNGAGTNDSIHAGLNGVLSNTADKIDGFPAGWNWSQRTRDGQPARLTVPAAGIHTVNFWMREDGFAIDKFILTKNVSYVPTGAGIGATANNGSGTQNNAGGSSGSTSGTGNGTVSTSSNTSNVTANANTAWKMVQTVNGSSVSARHEAGAVAISNNTMYVMGGRGNKPVQSFSESANKWTSHGNAPVRMNHFQPVAIGNKVYVIGAYKDDNYPNEQALEHVYVFDTSNHTWTKGTAIPQNRRRGSVGAAVYNNKIYLVGGNTLGHSGPAVNWFDEYDPATNQWRVMPNAPKARDHATIAVANGKLVVAGGRRTAHPNVWGDTEAKTDVFNFATGQWQNTADDIPTKRAGTMTVAVGDEVVVIGGETLGSSAAHAEVEALNVNTGKWRILQPLLEGRHSGGAVLMGDKIHVVSGNTTRGGGNESINHETLQLSTQP